MGLKDGRGDGTDGIAFLRLQLEKLQKLGIITHKRRPGINRTITSPAATTRLRAYMTEHAQTQAGLADKAHIGERTLRRLLQTNAASIRTWEEIAKAIGTTPEELLKTGQPAI
jgi:hypothetical protein